MANYTTLTARIVSYLQSIQQEGTAAFSAVYDFPTDTPSGYPYALVLPSSTQQGQYQNVAQNERYYNFDAIIYVRSQGSLQSNWADARTLVDSVIDKIDKSIDLGGLCDFVMPVPAEWTVNVTADGVEIIADVKVVCKATVNLYT